MSARDRLDNLKGLFQRQPFAALMIGIAMLSLAGIPPFPGFIAKFLIFKNVIAAGFTLYAVLGLVGSYLGIYFYLRVIQYLFMSAAEPTGDARHAGAPGARCRRHLPAGCAAALGVSGLGDRSVISASATSSAMSRVATSDSQPRAFVPSSIMVAQ